MERDPTLYGLDVFLDLLEVVQETEHGVSIYWEHWFGFLIIGFSNSSG